MPSDAPPLKRAATDGRGAEVITFDRYTDDREQLVHELAAERDLTLVHPYDNHLVMAGQGTVALELLGQVSALDAVVVPVGGGGLIAGTRPCQDAVAAHPRDRCRAAARAMTSRVRLRADGASGSRLARRSPTVSRPRHPGELTWPVIQRLVDEVVTVSDEQIVGAMRVLFERCKLVAEPSGASALAALLAGTVSLPGKRVGVIVVRRQHRRAGVCDA